MNVPTERLYAADAQVRSRGVVSKLLLMYWIGAMERERPAWVISWAAHTTDMKAASFVGKWGRVGGFWSSGSWTPSWEVSLVIFVSFFLMCTSG